MTVSKITTIITNNLRLTDGGASVTTQSQATTTGFTKHIFIKISNDDGAHTIGASGQAQTSTDNINFYDFHLVTGSLVSGIITSISFNIPAPVQYFRIVWTPGTGGSSALVRAEYSEVKERGESLTDESGGLISAGGIISDNLDISTEFLLELKRIRFGLSEFIGEDLDVDDID